MQMLERYKTLGAMLALGEFSVSELAVLSGVRERTVSTVLRRYPQYVEQIGAQPSGRRGGQPRRWQLRSGAREQLRSQLLELERLGAGPWIGERQDDSRDLPAALIAAEDVLLRLAPAAADREERAEFVKLAQAHVDAAGATRPEPARPDDSSAGELWEHHRRIVQLLMDLEEVEQPAMGATRRSVASAGQEIATDLLLVTGAVADQALTDAVRRRVRQLPLSLFAGPPAVPMTEMPADFVTAGIELVPPRMAGVLIDRRGRRLATKDLVLKDMELETVVSGAAALVAALQADIPRPVSANQQAALGFQLGAPVISGSGTVLFYHKAPPDPPGLVREVNWPDRQPLGPLLEQATRMPVVVENDANAYAAYELWFGTGLEMSRFAVVLIREGVGGSLVIGHQLFDGPMELGNLSVLPEKGRSCDCGSIGCLETTGGVHGILENIARNLRAKNLEMPDVDSVESASRLAEDSNPDIAEAAEKAFKDAGYANAKGIGIIVNFAHPHRVVLYAPPVMTETSNPAGAKFVAEVEKFRSYCHTVYEDCELVIRPLRPYDGAHGAALLAMERCFGVTPATAADTEPTR